MSVNEGHMKRLLSLLVLSVLSSVLAWGAPQSKLTPVKATHPPVHRHKAHKAGKHPHPKRHRHAV